jgi:hypothetical protein
MVGQSNESVTRTAPKLKPAHTIQTLDGVVRQGPGSALKASQLPTAPKPKRTVSHAKAPATRRKAQRSKTLMRQAVPKPKLGSLFHAKAAPLTAPGDVTIVDGSSFWSSLNPQRATRAKSVHKSKLVSKFGSGKLFVKTAVLAVTEPPAATAHSSRHSEAAANNPIQKALDKATAHEQPKLKKPRLHHRVARKLRIKPKTLNIGASVVAALLLGGFMLYQNLPNLNVRLAAARAGFHASLPSYHPAGFALHGPINYAPGELTLNFRSNSDTRNFQVKQQTSNWNSETLLQAYVTKTKQPYQTYQDEGRTVYISDNAANLVTGNKWIQVKTDGSLSTEQMLKIVKSIN